LFFTHSTSASVAVLEVADPPEHQQHRLVRPTVQRSGDCKNIGVTPIKECGPDD
jgi:hypothetical protein